MKTKHLLLRLLLGVLLLGQLVPTTRAATNLVTIGSFFFSPNNLTVNVGDTVVWSNSVLTTHDTTRSGLWTSGQLTQGQRFSFTFTNVGSFTYFCGIHIVMHPEQTGVVSVVSAANNPPSVQLTNPVNNARFRAPASLALKATASDTDGSVTNVQFFTNEVFCGSAPIAPFNFTLNSVAAGNYRLTARAADNLGAVSTSSVVNVFVLTNALLTAPLRLPGGQFQFTIQGIAGQTYVAESSSNFQTWFAFATNLAPANSFNITDATATNILRQFYRARQDL